MTMRVVYHDDSHGMISTVTFQQLIESDKIKKFYRYSEDRWVLVGVDPVRKSARRTGNYKGPERRMEEVIALQLV
jgi:hypothetical protein